MGRAVCREARPCASNPRRTSIGPRCRHRRSPSCRQRVRHGRAPGPGCLSTPSCLKTGTRTEIITEARPVRALDGLPRRWSCVTFLHDLGAGWSNVSHPSLIRRRYVTDGVSVARFVRSGPLMDDLGQIGASLLLAIHFALPTKTRKSVFGGAPRLVKHLTTFRTLHFDNVCATAARIRPRRDRTSASTEGSRRHIHGVPPLHSFEPPKWYGSPASYNNPLKLFKSSE